MLLASFEASLALIKSRKDAPLAAESLVSEALFARLKFPEVNCVSESSTGQHDKIIS